MERDNARQQADMLSGSVAFLEGQLEEALQDKEQSAQQLQACEEQLRAAADTHEALLRQLQRLEEDTLQAIEQQQQQHPPASPPRTQVLESLLQKMGAEKAAAEAAAEALESEKAAAALLLHSLGAEQEVLSEQLRAMEGDKAQLEGGAAQLAARNTYLEAELRQLEAHGAALLAQQQRMEVTVAAAAAERLEATNRGLDDQRAGLAALLEELRARHVEELGSAAAEHQRLLHEARAKQAEQLQLAEAAAVASAAAAQSAALGREQSEGKAAQLSEECASLAAQLLQEQSKRSEEAFAAAAEREHLQAAVERLDVQCAQLAVQLQQSQSQHAEEAAALAEAAQAHMQALHHDVAEAAAGRDAAALRVAQLERELERSSQLLQEAAEGRVEALKQLEAALAAASAPTARQPDPNLDATAAGAAHRISSGGDSVSSAGDGFTPAPDQALALAALASRRSTTSSLVSVDVPMAAAAASALPGARASFMNRLQPTEPLDSRLLPQAANAKAAEDTVNAAGDAALLEQLASLEAAFCGLLVAKAASGAVLRAQAAELEAQVAQLVAEREAQELGEQSLMATKEWMTEELRSGQAELRQATGRLEHVEAQLLAARQEAGRNAAAAASMAEAQAKLAGAEAQAARLAEQLAAAEAAVERAESVRQAAPTATAAVAAPAAVPMDVMMETLVLHGELDDARAKMRTAQAQVEALGDMLAEAVMEAAAAEAEAEGLREGGAGAQQPAAPAPGGEEQPLPAAQAGRRSSSTVGVATPPGPDLKRAPLPGRDMPPPEHLGTRQVSPLDQTRQLRQELQQVAEALEDMFEEGELAGGGAAPHGRQALSSLRPAVIVAMQITDNVASSLQQQAQPEGASAVLSANAAAAAPGWRAAQQPWLPADLARARASYAEAREVYDVLRDDADDLNSRLWRWGMNLREQLNTAERAVTQAQLEQLQLQPTGRDLAWQQVLEQRDAYAWQAEAQARALQADLAAVHARLGRRDRQLVLLADRLVQLADQLTAMEGVVVQCEVASSRLAKAKPGGPLLLLQAEGRPGHASDVFAG